MNTKSEDLFQQYCDENAIPWERVPVGANRTPDYVVRLGQQQVVCEVKQIEQSQAEREACRNSTTPGVSAIFSPPNQLRPKLKKLGQLRTATSDGRPTMLVVYNNSGLPTALGHLEVVQAMYGELVLVETLRTDDQSYDTVGERTTLGGRKSLTAEHNTSLSAVAVLELSHQHLRLRVYHNVYASVVLNPDLLESYTVQQRIRPGDTSVSLREPGE